MTEALFIIRIVLASLMLICAGVVTALVLMQASNSDGTQAMTGASSDRDAYGQNSSDRKARRLKILTYVAAGIIAVLSIVFIILESVVA